MRPEKRAHECGDPDVRNPVKLHQIAQDGRDVHHDDAEVESGHKREDDLGIHYTKPAAV
jgi:hypothetical protein